MNGLIIVLTFIASLFLGVPPLAGRQDRDRPFESFRVLSKVEGEVAPTGRGHFG